MTSDLNFRVVLQSWQIAKSSHDQILQLIFNISKFYKSLRAIYLYIFIYIHDLIDVKDNLYIYAWQYKSNEHVNRYVVLGEIGPIDFLNHMPFFFIVKEQQKKKNTGRMKPLYKNPLLKRYCMSSHVIFTVMIKCNDWLLCYSHICLHIVHLDNGLTLICFSLCTFKCIYVQRFASTFTRHFNHSAHYYSYIVRFIYKWTHFLTHFHTL